MIRQDYIMRLIEQLAQAIARLVTQKSEDLEHVEATLRDVKSQLPIVPYLLDDLSPKALHGMLRSEDVGLVVCRLFVTEGLLHQRRGEPKLAARCYGRGIRLFLLCGGAQRHPEQAELFRDAARRLSATSLSAEERAALGLVDANSP